MKIASWIIGFFLFFNPLALFGQVKIEVPLARQATDYTCGIASLQSVLGYYGFDKRQDILAKDCKSNRMNGTDYKNMIRCAESYGLVLTAKTGMTLEELESLVDESVPVILAIQAWREDRESSWEDDWEDGHYVVAIGYDDANVYFMDPAMLGNYAYIPVGEFLSRWHDKERRDILDRLGMYSTNGVPSYNPREIKKLD